MHKIECSAYFKNLVRIGHPVGYFVFTLVYPQNSPPMKIIRCGCFKIYWIMDKRINMWEQNKRILLASFCNLKNIFLVDSQTPLSPIFNVEKHSEDTVTWLQHWKGRAGWNVSIGDCKTHTFNETGFWGVSTIFVHDCRLPAIRFLKNYYHWLAL